MKTYLPYIIAASVATILTRFLPYWLFKKKSNSHSLAYLQKYSGLMIMAILIIYSFILGCCGSSMLQAGFL